MPRACGEGKERRMRCVPLKKGRKGQGLGRETGRAGMGKGAGGKCKYGKKLNNHCRTKAEYLKKKRKKEKGQIVMGGRNLGTLGY